MDTLLTELQAAGALIKPASNEEIQSAEQALAITFSDEYRHFLTTFGVIAYQDIEVYGLGVPTTSYLNICTAVPELKAYAGYPDSAVPIFEIGDGHYYLYDNVNGDILCWASPHGGVYQKIAQSLPAFLRQSLLQG